MMNIRALWACSMHMLERGLKAADENWKWLGPLGKDIQRMPPRGYKKNAVVVEAAEAAAAAAVESVAVQDATPEPLPLEAPKRKGKTLAEKKAELTAAKTPPQSILSFINALPVDPKIADSPLVSSSAAPPEEIPKKKRGGKKTVESAVISTDSTVKVEKKGLESATVPAIAPAPEAPAKKRPGKKAAAASATAPLEPQVAPPKARVAAGTQADPVEDVQTIRVVNKTLGGRQVYFEPKKEKVYDLKFKYLGRWDSKKECIQPFPDSDAEP
jgi:hypothetical protein